MKTGDTGMPDGLSWSESGDYLRAWCLANDATYYAAPKYDFSYHAAVDQAQKAGKSVVVVEDLS